MATDFRRKQDLPALTEEIVRSYAQIGTINHLGHCPLPSYDVIISAIEDLKEVIYPGYRRREGLHQGNVEYHVGQLIDQLFDKLSTQIARSLQHEARVKQNVECGDEDEVDFEVLAQSITMDFLRALPDVRRVLAMDVQAAYDGDPACNNIDEVIFCYPGLEAVTIYRLANRLHTAKVPFIPRMMTMSRSPGIMIV